MFRSGSSEPEFEMKGFGFEFSEPELDITGSGGVSTGDIAESSFGKEKRGSRFELSRFRSSSQFVKTGLGFEFSEPELDITGSEGISFDKITASC